MLFTYIPHSTLLHHTIPYHTISTKERDFLELLQAVREILVQHHLSLFCSPFFLSSPRLRSEDEDNRIVYKQSKFKETGPRTLRLCHRDLVGFRNRTGFALMEGAGRIARGVFCMYVCRLFSDVFAVMGADG